MKKIAILGSVRFDWNTDTGCSAGTGGYLCRRACRREQYCSVRAADPGVSSASCGGMGQKESRRIKDKDSGFSSVEILDGMDGLLAVAQIPEAEILVTAIDRNASDPANDRGDSARERILRLRIKRRLSQQGI